jgi:MtN3 and saliva related transmembrane protein
MNDTIPTIIGLTAAFLTTFAFLPQALKTIKTKHTKDLSLLMLIMTDTGLICWLIYGILISSIPIMAANTVSIALISVILIMKIKYG